MIDSTIDVWIGGLLVGAMGGSLMAIANLIQTRILGKQAIALANETARLAALRQEADWARQDEVAAKLAIASDATTAIARANVVRTNEVARLAAATAADQTSQLKEIHSLVNSDKTQALQAELAQTKITLALLRRFVALDDQQGRVSTSEDLAAIKLAAASILRLETTLSDRGARPPQVDDEVRDTRDAIWGGPSTTLVRRL
jgi:hypothetical protein